MKSREKETLLFFVLQQRKKGGATPTFFEFHTLIHLSGGKEEKMSQSILASGSERHRRCAERRTKGASASVGRPLASERSIKTSTVLVAIAVAVTVVSIVVVSVVIINRQAEQRHNGNLVRIDDDDEDWKDLSYDTVLEKSSEQQTVTKRRTRSRLIRTLRCSQNCRIEKKNFLIIRIAKVRSLTPAFNILFLRAEQETLLSREKRKNWKQRTNQNGKYDGFG